MILPRTPAFMPYYPLGYPDPETSLDIVEALARHGADLIEIGLPFSDPLADGPIIQQATQQALQRGMTVARGLEMIVELRRRGVTLPLVVMSYYNPLLAYGLPRLAQMAERAQIQGFIIPDLPPEEAGDFEAALPAWPLIRMVAPTTPTARLPTLTLGARGFLYLVSVTGVTGARTELPTALPDFVARVRAQTTLPVCVGFGIGSPQQAAAVAQIADGVIVGSACVQAIGGSPNPVQAAIDLAEAYRAALTRNLTESSVTAS